MKTTGVSCVPKFGLLVFLGHPTTQLAFVKRICQLCSMTNTSEKYEEKKHSKEICWDRMPLSLGSAGCNQLLTSVADLLLLAQSLHTVFNTVYITQIGGKVLTLSFC